MTRVLSTEWLDVLPAHDPNALRSRRDLRRVNYWMANAGIMAAALRQHLTRSPWTVLELGSGDGHFLGQVAAKMKWRGTDFVLLDKQRIASSARNRTVASFGGAASVITADVLDWLPTAPPVDVVVTNLFLHHFDESRLRQLLELISAKTQLFVAVEPRRHHASFLCGQLLWLIGCNHITRHDATLSIRAGFRGRELSTAWPESGQWSFTERRAGVFSHLFVARRTL
jgi:SAM-dependent methyltransferase